MGENSAIEWTMHTFNPVVGCTKVSPACDRCYAETWAKRTGQSELWNGERRRTTEQNWRKPIKWNDGAKAAGIRQRVFCASLADVFDNQWDPEWRGDLWRLISYTPHLDWLLLTKRPQNIKRMLPPNWGHGWQNVWLGTTAEDQKHYDRRFGDLCKVPAALWFISHEPALGPITELYVGGHRPDWIIMGGESGHGARMMDPEWARDLRDHCAEIGLPFFFKQMTGKKPIPDDLLVRQFPRGVGA